MQNGNTFSAKQLGTRILAAVLMFVAPLFLTPWLIIPLAALYSFFWFAPELIVFGALIDTYFGQNYSIPFYTIGASVIVVFSELIKPYLSFYSS